MIKEIKKYFAIFAIAYKNYNVYIYDILGINITYVLRLIVILFMYKSIYALNWSWIINGYSITEISWALIFVQAIVVSKSRINDEINVDIKTGKIGVHLLNPVGYISYKFFECFPKSIWNLCISLSIGLGLWALFLWWISTSREGIIGWILLLLWGLFINFFWYMVTGLLWFYTEDSESFRLLYSKMDLFLWWNILPIPFMPVILQTIAFASPFAYAWYTAGLIFTNFNGANFFHYLTIQVIRIIIFIIICNLIYNHAKKKLTINGG